MLKFYYDLMSQPSRAVMLFLRCNNIPFEDCAIALRKGEHLTEEYKSKFPFHKVPAIEHDGFKLTESVAILRYLCEAFKSQVDPCWLPQDPKLRARIDQYMAWQHINTRLLGSTVFVRRFVLPARTQQPIDEKKLSQAKKDFEVCLDQFESVWLSGGAWDYVNGLGSISIADLLAACELEQSRPDIPERHRLVAAYLSRVRERLSPHYDDVHQFVHRLQQRAKI